MEKFYVQLDWLAFLMLGLMFGFGPIGIYESSKNSRIFVSTNDHETQNENNEIDNDDGLGH